MSGPQRAKAPPRGKRAAARLGRYEENINKEDVRLIWLEEGVVNKLRRHLLQRPHQQVV